MIGISALGSDSSFEPTVLVPSLMVELDKSDTLLSESPSKQAVRSECARFVSVGTVQFKDLFGLFAKIGDIRHTRLHAVRQLVLSDTALNFWVEFLLKLVAIQFTQTVEHGTPARTTNAIWVRKVQDGISTRSETNALIS